MGITTLFKSSVLGGMTAAESLLATGTSEKIVGNYWQWSENMEEDHYFTSTDLMWPFISSITLCYR